MSFLTIPGLASLNDVKKGSRICLVVDYPSHADVMANQALSDTAGTILAKCLGHANMSMAEVSVYFLIPTPCTQVSFVKYWTPKGGFTTEGTKHFESLQTFIKQNDFNVYVPLGEAALNCMTNKKGITKWRGSILQSIDYFQNVKCIPTIDPRTAARQYLFMYYMSSDFKRINSESMTKDLNLPVRSLKIQPSFTEARSYLQNILDFVDLLACDIEVYNNEVSCISFAISELDCMSIPFDDRWSVEEEKALWRLIALVLEDSKIEKIFQNGMFDISFLFARNKIEVKGYIHDTMIKHNLNYPDFPKGLGFITSIYTREPYYKDEGKGWFKDLKSGKGDINQFYTYNAKDSAVTLECSKPISEELVKFGNQKTYDFCERLMKPLLYMQARGILVDEAKLANHRAEAKLERDRLQAELKELCGFDLNVSSPAQCKNYFYNVKNYAVQTKKSKDAKTGVRKETVSTDDKAMKKLIRKYNSKEAKLVTQIRKYRKLIGTYLEVSYDTDKRLRCSFSLCTSSGRLTSSETIFGTGTNMQNLPKTFKEFLIADEGHLMCELDKAQAEWVLTAFVSGEGRMIAVVENNEDAHFCTASMMFGVPRELMEIENEVLGSSTDEDFIFEQRSKHCPEIFQYHLILPNMSCRQAGKKSNHSFNYGLSPQGFAIQYDMELKYAKRCYELYHNAYPGLRLWHAHIQSKLGRDRTLESLLGRRRRFLARWNDDLFKAAYSFIPQSTVAQALNEGIVKSYEDQYKPEFEFMKAKDLLNQVHDSELWQARYLNEKGEIDEGLLLNYAKIIKRSVENLDIPMYSGGRSFVVKSDCKVGFNAKNMENINCYASETEIVEQLKKAIAKLSQEKPKPIAEVIEEVELEEELNSDETEE